MAISKTKALFTEKCPRCRQGEVFLNPLYKLRKPLKTHTFCPVCRVRYEVEPGFFWGAMYISYALSVALFAVVIIAISILMDEPEFIHYLLGVLLATAVFSPFSFRFSRVLMLYWFSGIKYDSKFSGKRSDLL